MFIVLSEVLRWEKASSFYFLRHEKNEMCLTVRLAFLAQMFNFSTISALLTTVKAKISTGWQRRRGSANGGTSE